MITEEKLFKLKYRKRLIYILVITFALTPYLIQKVAYGWETLIMNYFSWIKKAGHKIYLKLPSIIP